MTPEPPTAPDVPGARVPRRQGQPQTASAAAELPTGEIPGADGRKGVDLARAALLQARAQARNRYEKQKERRDGRRGLRRSGSGPDDRDPQPLRRVMGRMIAERGWQTPAAVHGVIGRWTEIVGPGIAAHCVPERFEDGRLVVRTDSDNYATHVRWLAPRLLARINQELGDGTVTFIEVRGPAGASRRGRWSAGP
ncbi:DUF721 domain-containing protein [Yinghuangia sp. YIM S10712]|uniref:DUF721 domain-containing protein n=1 Tax=Yinghuangia sp. YIM S10712 TaxID=3436930 RepID=UPI003F5398ED